MRFPFILKVIVTAGVIVGLMSFQGFISQSGAEQVDCPTVLKQWEALYEDLKKSLSEYENLEKTSIKNIIERPVVDTASTKTIAAQVAEALSVKENMLKDQRNHCRNLINLENEAFEILRSCRKRDLSAEEKRAVKKINKRRKRLIKKVQLKVAEVREVRGQEMDYSYVGYYNNQQQAPHGRNAGGYWNHYQQMYQRWWGR